MSSTPAVDFSGTVFLATSEVGATLDRLNHRAEVILARHRECIRGRRILDIASHDGRFSFACLKLGAAHVTGIEGRPHLVERARRNLTELGFGPERFHFEVGDIFDHLPRFEPGQFDTILCLGFFYHTIRQVEMIREVARLAPRSFILDTGILAEGGTVGLAKKLWRQWRYRRLPKDSVQYRDAIRGVPMLLLVREDSCRDANTIEESGYAFRPTRLLIENLLTMHGMDFVEVNWREQGIEDWQDLKDYHADRRATFIATVCQPAQSRTTPTTVA